MYFLDVENLSKSLLKNELSEFEKTKYYIAALYLQLLNIGLPAYFWGFKLDSLGLISYILAALVGTYCIIAICRVNDKIDGKNIIERLVVLGFPAFIRALVLYWLLYFILAVVAYNIGQDVILRFFGFAGMPFFYWVGFEQIRINLIKARQ